jgi:N6-L-threonylcarbamoyladenine synthase
MIVLGIETSCDETAAAVVTDEGGPRILSNVVHSQLAVHQPFGGIVPEIAARAHLDLLDTMVERALEEGGLGFPDLDGIAVAGGPGLIGGVMVGTTMAKAFALVCELPFIAVNHLEGHALTPRLSGEVEFPYLLLLVSGGHCQLVIVRGVGRYVRLGTTIDDAAGEAFDKTAKLLGLPYPGGPALERTALGGDPTRFDLPRPMKGRPGCDFSFSGLKTAVWHAVEALGRPSEQDVADLAAATQAAIADALVDRTRNAIRQFTGRTLVVAGGVAANKLLRRQLAALAAAHDLGFAAPPPALCTDNGAMIAWAGLERLRLGMTDALDFAPRPRWPLDPDASPVRGAGVKA